MDRSARKSCTRESVTISTPTAVIKPSSWDMLHKPASEWSREHAAKHEWNEVFQRHGTNFREKVVAAETVTKNSAVLTEPTE